MKSHSVHKSVLMPIALHVFFFSRLNVLCHVCGQYFIENDVSVLSESSKYGNSAHT